MAVAEHLPMPDERRQAVSQWIEHNVRLVAQAMIEEDMDGQVVTHPFEVRDHQIEGWDALWQARLREATRGLIHLATGGGKTTLSAVDFLKYREECLQMDPPVEPRALYVSHKHEINQQAAETFRHIIPGLEEHFFDTRKAHKRPEVDITYAPIQSLFSKLHTFDPDEFEYIIWDEAHHLEAETYKKVLEYFNPLFEYALTGTPDRADGKDIRDYFGEALLSKGIPEGIAEGWLADVDYHIVFDKAIKEVVKTGFHPKTLQEIKDLFEKKASHEALAESIREEIEKLGLDNPKTMIFCESIEEADEMARLLGGVAYHSNTPDRPQILRDFKSGKIKVVTSKDMFNEGVDVPDAEVVVFLRATESDAVFQQQLGRGLRKIPGKDKVYVLDFVANIERIAKVRMLSDAIQKVAINRGDEVDIIDGTTTSGGGFKIRTRHGDFDFDTIAVDLLEKWNVLRTAAARSDFTKLNNEALVALALQIKTDGPLTQLEIGQLSKQKKFASVTLIVAKFGSMSNFQRACGFDARKSTRPHDLARASNEELVAVALELKPEGPLTMIEIRAFSRQKKYVSRDTICKKFGSIKAFYQACGFGETVTSFHMSNEEIVALALSLQPDRPLSNNDIVRLLAEKKFVSVGTISRRFGSLVNFQRACGFEPLKPGPKGY